MFSDGPYFYLVIVNIIKPVGLLKITVVAVFLNEQLPNLWFAAGTFISTRKQVQMSCHSPVFHFVDSRRLQKRSCATATPGSVHEMCGCGT